MNEALGMSANYNENSAFQKSLQSAAWTVFERGVLGALADNSCFTVLELGCATGGNSVGPMREIRRLCGPHVELTAFQCDLPSTKWEVLSSTMAGFRDEPRTYLSFISSSFYHPNGLCRKGSVDFVFSFTAVHWIREHNPLWRSDEEFIAAMQHAPPLDESFTFLMEQLAHVLKPGGTAFLLFPCASSSDARQTLSECGNMIRMWYALRSAWALLLDLNEAEDDAHGGTLFGVSVMVVVVGGGRFD